MIIIKEFTTESMLEGLARSMGEDDFNLLYVAICGHMDRHTQRQYMFDLISRGIIETSADFAAARL